MNLPAEFIKNIRNSFPGGAEWLERLPALIDEAARRWELVPGEPFLLSYNYVCAARRKDGSEAVLKIGVPNVELTSEINTLGVYAGQGACRILEWDAERGMLLLERLHPGRMLVEIEDDDQATAIAADVLKMVQRPAPQQEGFLSLRRWFDELKKLRPAFGGGTGPFPESSFALAEGLIRELFAEERPQVLLHGDFHHFNILDSERGWLVIDPKGVAGPAEYEVGPLLTNPYNRPIAEAQSIRQTQRRIAILSERLGFDPQRLRAWAICYSVLSSFWDMTIPALPANPPGASTGFDFEALLPTGGEGARAWTEIFIKTKV